MPTVGHITQIVSWKKDKIKHILKVWQKPFIYRQKNVSKQRRLPSSFVSSKCSSFIYTVTELLQSASAMREEPQIHQGFLRLWRLFWKILWTFSQQRLNTAAIYSPGENSGERATCFPQNKSPSGSPSRCARLHSRRLQIPTREVAKIKRQLKRSVMSALPDPQELLISLIAIHKKKTPRIFQVTGAVGGPFLSKLTSRAPATAHLPSAGWHSDKRNVKLNLKVSHQ